MSSLPASHDKPPRLLYAVYGVSGALSLAAQLVWFRIFTDRFGSTNLTFLLVLCAFIGGLAIGGLLSRRFTAWLSRRLGVGDALRLYGVIECAIAMTLLLTPASGLIPADAWGAFPYDRIDGVYEPTRGYQLSAGAIAAVCVLAPTVLMGTTFPLLCAVFGARRRFPSGLYAWNTFGAASGLLGAQAMLAGGAGHHVLLWLVIGLNLAIGVLFVVRGGAVCASPIPTPLPLREGPGEGQTERSPFGHRNINDPPKAAPSPGDAEDRHPLPQRERVYEPAVLLTCAALSGLLTGALEGDVFKRLWFLGASSTAAMAFVSLWAVLAIFFGSCTVRAIGGLRLWHIKIAYIAAIAVYALSAFRAYDLRDWFNAPAIDAAVEQAQQGAPDEWGVATTDAVAVRFSLSLPRLFFFVGVFVFPPFYLLSLLFPYVCDRLSAMGRHVGAAYGLNTAAFCLGLFTFVYAAPRISIFYSMKLVFVVMIVGAVMLLVLSQQRRPHWLTPLLAAGALGVGVALTPAGFDRAMVTPLSPPARYEVSSLMSDGTHTTYIVDDPAGKRLYFDNHSMSGTGAAAQTYMRLMAHAPLLMQQRPKRALLIGFGVGNTASAIASHETIERIDIAELNLNVIRTAPGFARTNDKVYADDRVRFIHDDGRHYLRVTDERYDLVTSEPPPPLQAGVERLYSLGYYESVAARLTESGIMSQWLPAYQMPAEAARRIIATFTHVFPHAVLIVGHNRELVLIGGRQTLRLGSLAENMSTRHRARYDLNRIGVYKPVDLLARIVMIGPQLRQAGEGARLISDARDDLAFLQPQGEWTDVVTHKPDEIVSHLGARLSGGVNHDLSAILSHTGRLRYRVDDFPFELISHHEALSEPGAPGAVNWSKVDKVRASAQELAARGRIADATRLMEGLESLVPQAPQLMLDLAYLYMQQERFDAAEGVLRRFLTVEPREGVGYAMLASAQERSGRGDEAVETLKRAAQMSPDDARVHKAYGDLLVKAGRLAEAIEAYRRAVELDPYFTAAHQAKYDAQQQKGAAGGQS